MKKVHWTQTPEGRAKMAKAQRKAWRTRKKKEKSKPQQRRVKHYHASTQESIDDATFSYVLGYVESYLQTFSRSAGVSGEALASRLGEVLSSKSNR